jgi:DNA mismatch repair protein MutL
MRRRLEAGGLPAQRLLVPLTVELSPRDLDIATRHLEVLAKFGIVAEPFGGQTLKIDAVPPFLKSDDPESFFHGVLDEIRTADDRSSALRLGEDIIATTVCRHAVKANDRLHERELEKLLVDLLACDMPYCCPHGRPTLIQIGYGELERKFGRRT